MEGRARLSSLLRSETGQAAGMGVAVAISGLVSLIFSVVFVRLLGSADFGSLASLLSAWLILAIPGTALQTAVAREVSAAAADGQERELMTSVRGWVRTAALGSLAVTALAVLLRHQVADVLGVPEEWGAASTVPAAALWMLVSIQRGALQGVREYRTVGVSILCEAGGRLGLGLLFVALGGGVTGAFLGHAAAMLVIALFLERLIERRVEERTAGRRPLAEIVRLAAIPGLSLVLLSVLQNVDVIVVKNQVAPAAAGSYAVMSLVAKSIVWVAVGLGMYLLPETSRRAAAGEPTRRLLARTLGLTAAVALPVVAVYALAGPALLEIVFGREYEDARVVLTLLGLAMALLAFSYLAVQYLLALRRVRFLWLLAAVALLEPPVLVLAGERLTTIALALTALQLALCVPLLALDARRSAATGRAPGAAISSRPS